MANYWDFGPHLGGGGRDYPTYSYFRQREYICPWAIAARAKRKRILTKCKLYLPSSKVLHWSSMIGLQILFNSVKTMWSKCRKTYKFRWSMQSFKIVHTKSIFMLELIFKICRPIACILKWIETHMYLPWLYSPSLFAH